MGVVLMQGVGVGRVCVCVCAGVCVRVGMYVRACIRACVGACVRPCVYCVCVLVSYIWFCRKTGVIG